MAISSSTMCYVAEPAFTTIQFMNYQYMYPFGSVSYRGGKEYFEKKKMRFRRDLATFYQKYVYNLYVNVKPFTEDEIIKMIDDLMENNERFSQFFNTDRATAIKILRNVNIKYLLQYAEIKDEMDKLRDVIWIYFQV